MTQALDPQSRLRRAGSVLETEVDGEIVLMSMEAGNCYGLDRIGSEIWRSLQAPATVRTLQDECCERYTGDAAAIRADVTRLLSDLVEERLVEPAP